MESYYAKKAVKRSPSGVMYLDCLCGAPLPVDYPDGPDVLCICGRLYTAQGWIVTPGDRREPQDA